MNGNIIVDLIGVIDKNLYIFKKNCKIFF